MNTVITAHGVSFELPNGRRLFSNLQFSLGDGVTALVGPNGIGKTCLARLLAGELEPTSGRVQRNEAVAYLPQRSAPRPMTVADFLSGAYSWSIAGEQLLEGIDRDALCTTLSGGEWMRLRLASIVDDSFLILDEPTNDLDRDGRDAVVRFLRDHRGGALLISHDRECLRLCDDVLELSNKGLARFGGGWSEYEVARTQERERLAHALDVAKRKRDDAAAERVVKLERQGRRNRQAAAAAKRGGMPKILIGGRKRRAEVSTGAIDVATLARANDAVREAHEALDALKVDPVMYAELLGRAIPAQKLVAEARGFNVRFDDWLYPRDLDFTWRGNVRIALNGPNGSGKSTLLRAILGDSLPTKGELRRGDLVTLHVDQRCASLDDAKSVFENVRDVSGASESEIRNQLAQFLFAKDEVFHKAATLSGGERLRAALARGLLAANAPELMILDEPTNNLDLVNIEFLEKLARSFRGALIVISHDEVFLENCGITEELVLG